MQYDVKTTRLWCLLETHKIGIFTNVIKMTREHKSLTRAMTFARVLRIFLEDQLTIEMICANHRMHICAPDAWSSTCCTCISRGTLCEYSFPRNESWFPWSTQYILTILAEKKDLLGESIFFFCGWYCFNAQ